MHVQRLCFITLHIMYCLWYLVSAAFSQLLYNPGLRPGATNISPRRGAMFPHSHSHSHSYYSSLSLVSCPLSLLPCPLSLSYNRHLSRNLSVTINHVQIDPVFQMTYRDLWITAIRLPREYLSALHVIQSERCMAG